MLRHLLVIVGRSLFVVLSGWIQACMYSNMYLFTCRSNTQRPSMTKGRQIMNFEWRSLSVVMSVNMHTHLHMRTDLNRQGHTQRAPFNDQKVTECGLLRLMMSPGSVSGWSLKGALSVCSGVSGYVDRDKSKPCRLLVIDGLFLCISIYN